MTYLDTKQKARQRTDHGGGSDGNIISSDMQKVDNNESATKAILEVDLTAEDKDCRSDNNKSATKAIIEVDLTAEDKDCRSEVSVVQ